MDDPYDLTESVWRRRFARRLAQERSRVRAKARTEALAIAEEFAAPVQPAKRRASPALVAHLANARLRAHAARWRGVDPMARSAFMSWVVRHRSARTTIE